MPFARLLRTLPSSSTSAPTTPPVWLDCRAPPAPIGVDPTHAQWDEISRLCKEYKRTVVMDAAYLGYASGSVDNDAYAIRKVYFLNEILICV